MVPPVAQGCFAHLFVFVLCCACSYHRTVIFLRFPHHIERWRCCKVVGECKSSERRHSPGRNESGRGPDAGHTVAFKETDADRTRAVP
eukprot:gene9404-biopygen22719